MAVVDKVDEQINFNLTKNKNTEATDKVVGKTFRDKMTPFIFLGPCEGNNLFNLL